MDATIVIEAHFERATFADEPVKVIATSDGRTIRKLGGPNKRGGNTYILTWTPSTPAGTWPAAALPVTLAIGLPRSRDLGIAEDVELDVASRSWARVACSAFRLEVGAATTVGPGDDGTSGVYFEDTTWPSDLTPGAIATTVLHVDAQAHIYDTDIYMNGADHVFSLDGHAGTIDFRSIATHEIGHVLGLGESADPIATMYTAYPPGVAWRSLEEDDRNGVCTLYPGTGDALGCEATPCPNDFVCVARECERLGDQRMICSPCEPSITSACEGAGDKARCVAVSSGYTCGRPCVLGDDCGTGFTCVATTSSGDYQCVSSDGCKTAANPCTIAADCTDPSDAGWICGGGACAGPLPVPDAGTDASFDASDNDSSIGVVRGGGCNASGGDGAWAFALALAALGARYKRNGTQRRT